MITFTENGVTFPTERCVLGTCDYERFGREGLSICYCEARLTILELEAAGRCTNCGAIPTCACHTDGCPDDETCQKLSYFHVCEAVS